MAEGRRPDAIFGVNDIMAMGAMDVLRLRHGLSIPGDVMMAGFDDIPESARPPYALTTVHQPIRRMVHATIDLLHLEDPTRPIDLATDNPIAGELVWRSTVPGEPPQAG